VIANHAFDDLVVYDQRDERFQADGDEALQDLRLAQAGCGVFSFCNAVHALNGCLPDAVRIGQWAMRIGAYRPSEKGTYRKILYDNVEQKFGEELGFRVAGQFWGTVADDRLTSHLLCGGTAVVHVPDHFLALVGYDPQAGSFHVIESRVSLRRRLRRDGWVAAERLSSGHTCVDWYVLLEKR
jgi:hypothetical protein